MKTKFILPLVVLAVLTSCRDVKFSLTEKPLAKEYRQLTGFERITLLGSLDVKYQQADSFSVRVEAPENVIEDVETTIDGNLLKINMKGDRQIVNFGKSEGKHVTVYVTSPDFLGVEVKGSGDFDCLSHLDTDNLDITVRGSGDAEFEDVICDNLYVSVVGSGDVEIRQTIAQQANLEVVGSGDIDTRFKDSGIVNAYVTGSGDIKLNGRVRKLSKHIRGSGDITTKGLQVQ